MIKKHIAHLATESLKFFFNIDHSICHHWMVTMVILLSIAKVVMNNILKVTVGNVGDAFRDGVHTVRYDLYVLKTNATGAKGRIEKSEQYQNFTKNIHQMVSKTGGMLRLNFNTQNQ